MNNLSEIISKFDSSGKAIAHFNVSNFDQIKAILEVASQLGEPVIIGLSEGERNYLGVKRVAYFIRDLGEELGCSVFLNADHTHSSEKAREAAEAGFDAVLFDGGKLSFNDNIEETKKAVSLVKEINPKILVEGELGYIGDSSKVLTELPKGAAFRKDDMTNPDDAERFVRETGVDLLAPAVGNIHGIVIRKGSKEDDFEADNPEIDTERIKNIRSASGVPLVLHGGSGIKDNEFKMAIKSGISIIHISTELRVAWRRGMEDALRKNPKEFTPYKISPLVVDSVSKIVRERVSLFSK